MAQVPMTGEAADPSLLSGSPPQFSPSRGQGAPAHRLVPEGQRAPAKTMRRELTPAERLLWHALRAHRFQDFQFRRQAPMGPYITDSVCRSARLVVEIDGAQHGLAPERDRARDAWFMQAGYRTMRFWNREILRERDVVLDTRFTALTDQVTSAGDTP
jgi:very-short-patch-repair endonuclease